MAFRHQSEKIYWYLVSVFILFTMTIVMLGSFFYEHQKKTIKQEKKDQLDAIADLKAQQIINWRKERIGDAMVIFENQFLLSNIHQWLENPSDSIRRGKILTWMTSLQKYFGYKDIDLLDTKGTLRLSIPEGNRSICSYTQAMTGEAIRTKRIVFMDLHKSDNNDEIHLGIAIPLLVPKGDDIIPIAVLHLLIDPYQFLYPLIQSWPTPSPTAESLLVRREGEEALFLNELRHRKNAALTLRVPISKQQMPAAIAALGGEGIVEGINYRGVGVLAAIRRIPESPWSLIAHVDQEEIYAPIRQQVWFIGIVVGLLIAGGGLGVGLLWRHQRAEFYKSQYKAELERQALAQHFDYLTKYANDMIFLMDQDLKIIEANERASASYGYTRDELLQLNAWDLRSPETKPLFDSMLKQLEEEKGLVFETVHQRKDGTTFPVEISMRVIEVEGRKFYQGILRDITIRKQMEEALRQSKEFSETVFNCMNDIISVIDVTNFKIIDVNQVFLDKYGMKKEEVIGKICYEITHHRSAPCTPADDICPLLDTLKTGKHSLAEHVHYSKNGEKIYVEVSTSPIKDEKGEISQVVHVVRDITERKRAEEALRESESKFQELFDNAPVGYHEFDVEGRITKVNLKELAMFGYTVEEMLGHPVWEFLEDKEKSQQNVMAKIAEVMPSGGQMERTYRRKDGTTIPVLMEELIIRDKEGRIIGLRSTQQDISDRKRVEEEREKLIQELQKALAEVKTLSGLIPICASCKKIRDDKGYWNQIETYIRDHSEADFSHGICPECAKKLYPELYKEDIKNRKRNAR